LHPKAGEIFPDPFQGGGGSLFRFGISTERGGSQWNNAGSLFGFEECEGLRIFFSVNRRSDVTGEYLIGS
jgi:hypothetical protein